MYTRSVHTLSKHKLIIMISTRPKSPANPRASPHQPTASPSKAPLRAGPPCCISTPNTEILWHLSKFKFGETTSLQNIHEWSRHASPGAHTQPQ